MLRFWGVTCAECTAIVFFDSYDEFVHVFGFCENVHSLLLALTNSCLMANGMTLHFPSYKLDRKDRVSV